MVILGERAVLRALVQQLLAQIASRHGVKPARLSRAARAALHAHVWPGNIRELRNVLEVASLLQPGKRLRVEHLPAPFRAEAAVAGAGSARAGYVEISLDQRLRDSVAQIIRATLAVEEGNPRARRSAWASARGPSSVTCRGSAERRDRQGAAERRRQRHGLGRAAA